MERTRAVATKNRSRRQAEASIRGARCRMPRMEAFLNTTLDFTYGTYNRASRMNMAPLFRSIHRYGMVPRRSYFISEPRKCFDIDKSCQGAVAVTGHCHSDPVCDLLSGKKQFRKQL